MIKPNFEIPKDYERLFMLFNERGWKCVIVADHNGIHCRELGGPPSDEEQSLCLDWIAEVICGIRAECDQQL